MSKKHTADADEDDVVVFNTEAYSVVSSWISKAAITEEDIVTPKFSKPLYTKPSSSSMTFATDEDKFLASKILKKKRQDVVTTARDNDKNDVDDDVTSFRHKGQSSVHGAKKQKTLSVQEKLLQSLREQQERRKLKNKKKKDNSKKATT
ncbi:hypothetical protein DYB37_003333 [Aphanomyces astaci]|uniref:Uncharacterized protein n=1 Tax=Aphanomyces astaci TaxID=112090 RepID=A0A3R6WZ32_APHAT|nr:hypothetical protein DYB35_003359 [Aphanomyces astaci]RHZ25079.1 hypothetical protein DYB37_003333 [Aphanomyces astaci]